MVTETRETGMDEAPLDDGSAEARGLRFLRRLVTLLTVVMIGGVLTIVALLVIRLQAPPPGLALPAEIELPAGAEAAAVTALPGRVLVLTTDDRILLYDAEGALIGQSALSSAD